MKRIVLSLIAALFLAAAFIVFAGTINGKATDEDETANYDQWEYLVVSGNTTNFSPSGNPNLRKDPNGAFRREAFVLEQNMDKLGAKGWELVSVTGPDQEPIYYFKRRKK